MLILSQTRRVRIVSNLLTNSIYIGLWIKIKKNPHFSICKSSCSIRLNRCDNVRQNNIFCHLFYVINGWRLRICWLKKNCKILYLKWYCRFYNLNLKKCIAYFPEFLSWTVLEKNFKRECYVINKLSYPFYSEVIAVH